MEENISTFVDDDLNEYCLLEIFSYLSINDMMQIKNVCRKWRQMSQQWFKQVQTVKFQTPPYGTWKWKLHAKHFKRELGTGTEIKELIPILKLFGRHIKYYFINYSKKNFKETTEREKLTFQLIPTLCENVVDANIYTQSYSTWDVDAMAKHWKQLKKFRFECFSESVEKNMSELLRNNQQLEILTLRHCNISGPQSDIFFTYLPRKIKKIDLNIGFSGKKELKYFVFASENFTSLSSLLLSNFNCLSDAAGEAIGKLKSLKHLALYGIDNYESRRTIDPIANLENLKSLQIIDNNDLDEDNLIFIVNNCKQLEQLTILSEILTDKGMTAISGLKRLKILAIRAEFVTSNSIINLCDSLEVFFCDNSRINNNDAIKLLEKATNLWYVELMGCLNLTKDVIEAANEIANERKGNILQIRANDEVFSDIRVDTPYFKCCNNLSLLSLELLPSYIRVYLEGYHPYG